MAYDCKEIKDSNGNVIARYCGYSETGTYTEFMDCYNVCKQPAPPVPPTPPPVPPGSSGCGSGNIGAFGVCLPTKYVIIGAAAIVLLMSMKGK